MESKNVDVAVIGAGTAGLNARREALKHGSDVVLIEDGPYGTTCARVGCMPSKLLIAAADAAHDIRHAHLFGIHTEGVQVDDRAVLARVRSERDRFVGFVTASVHEIPSEQKLRGTARFTGPTQLEVHDTQRGRRVTVDARSVVIATGSTPWFPPVLKEAGDRLLLNDDIFEVESLPESIAVIGTGIIGLELGQALHRLGVRTTFLSDVDLLGPVTDPAMQEKARSVIGSELDLRLRIKITQATRTETGVEVSWTDFDGKSHREEFERLLAATGRRPRLQNLGLENTGIQLDPRGVPLFDSRTMQCGTSPIFIAGDATLERPLLHEAADEGHTAGENAARYPDMRAHRRRTPLTIVFSDPQMAVVGTSHAELRQRDIEFEYGEASYDDQGRARIMGKNAGLVRIYGSTDCGTLLGAEMLGPRVENTAHLLAWAVQSRLNVVDALAMPFYHPVLEEGIRTALRDLAARLRIERASDPLEVSPGS